MVLEKCVARVNLREKKKSTRGKKNNHFCSKVSITLQRILLSTDLNIILWFLISKINFLLVKISINVLILKLSSYVEVPHTQIYIQILFFFSNF